MTTSISPTEAQTYSVIIIERTGETHHSKWARIYATTSTKTVHKILAIPEVLSTMIIIDKKSLLCSKQ